MKNIPKVKAGIVAASRDCFTESLSVNRRKALSKHIQRNTMLIIYMNVRYALLRVRYICSGLWRI